MTNTSFPLPIGHVLPEGTIVDVTLTAYQVVSEAGTAFVPFTRVHQPRPQVGLVTFGDGSRYNGQL